MKKKREKNGARAMKRIYFNGISTALCSAMHLQREQSDLNADKKNREKISNGHRPITQSVSESSSACLHVAAKFKPGISINNRQTKIYSNNILFIAWFLSSTS